ncbi:MAG: NYN domain-containing protein [Opitutales bacterium]
MSQTWIVDGHNVIHARPDLQKLLRDDSTGASAQRVLIEQIRIFADFGSAGVKVAFDSGHLKSLSEKWQERQRSRGVEIHYGSAEEQADTIIERWVVACSDPSKVFVVTEDRAIRHVIEAAGAFSVSVQEFTQRRAALEVQQSRMLKNQNARAADDFRNGLPL